MDSEIAIEKIKAAIEASARHPEQHEVHLSSTNIGTRKTIKLYGNVEADVLRFDEQSFIVIRHYLSPIAVLNWWWDERPCAILSHCGEYRHGTTTSKAQNIAQTLLDEFWRHMIGNVENHFITVPVTPQALTRVPAPISYHTISTWVKR